jgi:hypothetical protein
LEAPLVQDPDSSNWLDHDDLIQDVKVNIQKVSATSAQCGKLLTVMQMETGDEEKFALTGRLIDEAKALLESSKAKLLQASQVDQGKTAFAAHRRLQREKLAQSMQEAVSALQRIAELRVSVSLNRDRADTMSVPVKAADIADSVSTSHATNASWVHEVDTHDLDESRAPAQMELELHERAAEDRAQSIHSMQQDVHEISKLFNELAGLAHDQGQQVESIEASMGQAAQSQREAVQQLTVTHQRTQRCKCQMAAIASVLSTAAFIVVLSLTK